MSGGGAGGLRFWVSEGLISEDSDGGRWTVNDEWGGVGGVNGTGSAPGSPTGARPTAEDKGDDPQTLTVKNFVRGCLAASQGGKTADELDNAMRLFMDGYDWDRGRLKGVLDDMVRGEELVGDGRVYRKAG